MSYLSVTVEETGLRPGEKYTMLGVGDWSGMTNRVELTIEAINCVEQYAQYSNILQVVFKARGKRKQSAIFLKGSMLFLKGWDLGMKIDTDFGSFSVNALINLVGNPQELREKIEQLNAYKLANKGVIVWSSLHEPTTSEKKLLYPDIADLDHAVVRRIVEDANERV